MSNATCANRTDARTILLDECLWARQLCWQARRDCWLPDDISLQIDRELWASGGLSDSEKAFLIEALQLLSAVSLQVERTSVEIYALFDVRACQQCLLQHACDATNHVRLSAYCEEQLGIKLPALVKSNAATTVHSLLTHLTQDSCFSADLGQLIITIAAHYLLAGVVVPSIWSLMLEQPEAVKKAPGMRALFKLVARDLVCRHELGCNLINAIKSAYPVAWDEKAQQNLLCAGKQCVETVSAHVLAQKGSFAADEDALREQLVCTVDYTFERLDLTRLFGTRGCPAWMTQQFQVSGARDAVEMGHGVVRRSPVKSAVRDQLGQ